MGTTREEVDQWIEAGIEAGATHLIVFCDSFSYEDYPVYVKPGQTVDEVKREVLKTQMQRVMEVVDLHLAKVLLDKKKLAETVLRPEPEPFPTDLDAEVTKL